MKGRYKLNEKLVLWLCHTLTRDDETPCMPDFSDSDWNNLVSIALRNGVLSLLYHQIRPFRSLFPELFISTLRQHYLMSLVRSELLLQEKKKLIDLAASKGIPILLLKGIYLSSYLYKSPNLRPMSDIDVLIPMDYLQDISEEICKRGGEFIEGTAASEFHHHLPACFLAGSSIRVEIHHTIAPRNFGLNINVSKLWQRSMIIEPKIGLRALSHEDLLLHLCIHLAISDHYQVPLRSYYDIYLLLFHHGDQFEWDTVCVRAKAWGCAVATYIVLCICHDLFKLSPYIMSMITPLRPVVKTFEIDQDQISKDVVDLALKGTSTSNALAAFFSGRGWRYIKSKKTIFPSRNSLAYVTSYRPGTDFWFPTYIKYFLAKVQTNISENRQMIIALLRYDREAIKILNRSKRFYLLSEMNKSDM